MAYDRFLPAIFPGQTTLLQYNVISQFLLNLSLPCCTLLRYRLQESSLSIDWQGQTILQWALTLSIPEIYFQGTLTFTGSLNLRFLSSPLISSISDFSRFHPVTSRFCANLPGLLLFGMTAISRCVAHRSSTCAGVLPCFSAIFFTVSLSISSGVSLALCMSISRNDCGPNDEYAVTTMPWLCAY